MSKRWFLCAFLGLLFLPAQFGLERPDVTFKIFQFPPDKIPRIDGNTDDWAMVPDSYAIGMDQLMDTEHSHGMNHDPKNLDVKVKVGWVTGLNRLYFLYEAYDNYWDFARTDLH
ncbi:MAG TPA: hypothetical protein VFC29_10190, partial [Candidatus Limnocylindrales bacterium]|nr:hypothetical protein [Candidatus Limnocylindrales bacterium]